MHFSYNEIYHRMGIEWEKSTHTMKKVWVSIPRLSPYHGFCCTFPYCGKLLRKRMHFPMLKYTIGRESDGKKHPYYGKSMSINFPDFRHTMIFVAFSRTVVNLWGNPCISHMMTLVIFFQWTLATIYFFLPVTFKLWIFK